MRIHPWLLGLCLPTLCHAQMTRPDQAVLSEARAKYDAPFTRNLQSFTCTIDFDWKAHWKEAYRVGDEGTDAEIERFIQPISNRVTVTRDDAVISSGMTEEKEHALPRGGMAEGLLKHAVRFSLRTWLGAANDALLPPPDTPVHYNPNPSGYQLEFKVQTYDVVMMLTSDMSLLSMAPKGSDADLQLFTFKPGPQGFLVDNWTMGEDGNLKAGNRLIFGYTYQNVDGFQIPAHGVVIRESHREAWNYTLSNCKVTIAQ